MTVLDIVLFGIRQLRQDRGAAVQAARMAALMEATAAQSDAIAAMLRAGAEQDARVVEALGRIETLEREAAEWRRTRADPEPPAA